MKTIAMTMLMLAGCSVALAQLPDTHIGEVVPRDVRELYERGLNYLVATQAEDGSWQEGNNGAGQTGLCVLAFLASGEDPNFGLYAVPIRKGLKNIVRQQDANTGFFGSSMYHHGFAMLALAEAYGAVDESNFWSEAEAQQQRSLGGALELGVRAAITSQKKNQFGAWRYSPNSSDADTSVAGAVLVGLLAARNAGIEVPDEAIDRAIAYFKSMTSNTGQVAYSGMGGFGESLARTSIACTVYAYARRQDMPQFEQTLNNLTGNLEQSASYYREYTQYYEAQALFQGDIDSWGKWNKLLVRDLKERQDAEGCIPGDHGKALGTSMSLLAVALNFRFLPIYER
jgi:hypothetical protein